MLVLTQLEVKMIPAEFVARHMEDGKLIAIYSYVPKVGMDFMQSTKMGLWENDNNEPEPSVDRRIYNTDKKITVHTFTVDHPLRSNFWIKIEGIDMKKLGYEGYF
jgi:hypothetical protein